VTQNRYLSKIIPSPRRKSKIQLSTIETFSCRKNYFPVQKKATACFISSNQKSSSKSNPESEKKNMSLKSERIMVLKYARKA